MTFQSSSQAKDWMMTKEKLNEMRHQNYFKMICGDGEIDEVSIENRKKGFFFLIIFIFIGLIKLLYSFLNPE